MLVPREHAAIALRVRNRNFTGLVKQARSLLPITEKEIDRLKREVTEALQAGPVGYAGILDRVPPDLVRPFPEGLRRLGLNGSLWLAVNLLKEEGRIIKVQSGRRLDSTEYCFALVSEVLPELEAFEIGNERANAQLAALYFAAEGPARIRDFAWWAGIHVTEAIRSADEIEPRLARLEVEGSQEEFLIPAADLEAFRNFSPPPKTAVNLIPYRDTYLKGQREIVNRFVRDEHFEKPFSRWKGKLINDPLATILANGQVIGIWEWTEPGRVEFILFDEPARDVAEQVEARAGELTAFIRDELGTVRLQGLDYGKNQMTAIHELRGHWGQGAEARVG